VSSSLAYDGAPGLAARRARGEHLSPRIAIVVGMKSEARIADVGPDLTIIGGGSAAQVEAGLARVHRYAKSQGRPLHGVLSFGVAGALAPHLRPGDVLLPIPSTPAPSPMPVMPAGTRDCPAICRTPMTGRCLASISRS